MTRTIPVPAVPHGAKFDPDATIMDNAREAWRAQKNLNRAQRERNARVLARRIFRTDDLEFEYELVYGLDVPTFVVEDEKIVFFQGERGSTFALAEVCGECGQQWNGRAFASLAELGKRVDERDEDEPFVCRNCQLAGKGRRR